MGLHYNSNIIRDNLILEFDVANVKCLNTSNQLNLYDTTKKASSINLVDGPIIENNTITFDGVANKIHVNNTNCFYNWTPTGKYGSSELTIDLYIKTTDTDGYILSQPWNGAGEYNLRLLNSQFLLNVGNQTYTVNFPSISNNLWNNITITINTLYIVIYINGELYTTNTHGITNNDPTNGANTIPLTLMSLYPYGSPWVGNSSFSIAGSLGPVKMYNRVLTATQIKQNFEATRGRFGI